MELKVLVVTYLIGGICSAGVIIYITKTLKETLSLSDLIWSFLMSWFQVILFIVVGIAGWLDKLDTPIFDFREKEKDNVNSNS